LNALDNKEIFINGLDINNPNTIVHRYMPNNTIIHSSNHVVPVTYDNPAFINESGIIIHDNQDDNTARTSL
jgi:hypothetical protein